MGGAHVNAATESRAVAPAAGPVLLTGGSGRLGSELRALLPQLGWHDLLAPRSGQLDVTNAAGVASYAREHLPRLVVHAAAYTNVAQAEEQRDLCWRVNVEGTRNLVAAARSVGAAFVLVSTDYVFYGDARQADGAGAGYREDDTPGPVRNYYSLTKLVAEEAARAYENSLVLRTSFRPREWPYPVAYDDLFTTQDYVDVIAPLVAEVLYRYDLGEVPYPTLHVATDRKSVYDLARRRAPEVGRASRSSSPVELPADVSLNTDRLQELRASWRARAERPKSPPR